MIQTCINTTNYKPLSVDSSYKNVSTTGSLGFNTGANSSTQQNYNLIDNGTSYSTEAKTVDMKKVQKAVSVLKGNIEDYDEYMRIAFALATLGEEGRKYFIEVCSGNPKYPHDTPEILSNDFSRFLSQAKDKTYKGKTININTLFYLAKKRTKAEDREYENFTEEGLSNKIVEYFGVKLRFNHSNEKWYIWNGCIWQEDTKGAIHDYVKQTKERLLAEIIQDGNSEDFVKIFKGIRQLESYNKIKNILKITESNPTIRITEDELDNKSHLLNCLNGVLDLNSMEFIKHDSSYLLTQVVQANYDREAKCEKWLAFLNKIFNSNQIIIDYIQRSLGYTLSGSTDADCLFFMYGTGANGKSTFVKVLEKLFNNYCTRANIDLLKKNVNNSARNDVARLKGARFVVTSEVEQGFKLNESLIKDLTGGDTVTARFLFKEYTEYVPICKIWIYGNYKPNITGIDEGIRRRIKLIPFTITIPIEERRSRNDILTELENEISGILNWCLQGYQSWKEDGLNEPDVVKSATSEYFSEMDVVQNFLDTNCEEDINSTVSFKELYSIFVNYASTTGEELLNNRDFNGQMKLKGYKQCRDGSGCRWSGLKLKQVSESNNNLESKNDIESNNNSNSNNNIESNDLRAILRNKVNAKYNHKYHNN